MAVLQLSRVPTQLFHEKSKHMCSSLMGAVYSQTHSSFWGPFQLLNSALAFCVRTEAYWECLMWLSHLITQKRTSVFTKPNECVLQLQKSLFVFTDIVLDRDHIKSTGGLCFYLIFRWNFYAPLNFMKSFLRLHWQPIFDTNRPKDQSELSQK